MAASKSRSRRNTAGRGFVNNTILECLLDGDKYGYEIIKEVKEKSNGEVVLKEPSLYSSLKRFEQKGYISSYWGDSDIGGRRHYYSLTEPGKAYYNSLKLPKKFELSNEEKEESKKDENEQITIENLNQEIYNIEENNCDVDDDKYIKNANFNVDDEIDKLLNDNQTNDENIELKKVNDIKAETIFDSKEINDTENKNELIEEFNNVLNNDNNAKEDDSSNIKSEEYSLEYKFRNTQNNEISNGKEKFVQYDLFNTSNQTNYVDSPSIKPEAISTSEEKSKIEANKSEKEISKDIPLIKEQEVDFFNWNELKRQAVNNKSSFTNSALNSNNNYALDKEDNFKSKNELHKIFDNAIKSPTPNNIDNQEKENHSKNKIFDNVKDRIEVKDVVMEKPIYNDEPELSEEETRIINQRFNEKFNQLANQKVEESKKEEIDYKKILGDLYYQDVVTSEENNDNDLTNDNKIDYENDNNENYTNYSNEEIENYKEEYLNENSEENESEIKNLIINNKNYSFNSLNESLTNDGFKFKPYSIDYDKEECEQFVKINKVKLIFGSILSLIMLLQIFTVFIILKYKDLIYVQDTALYVVSIVLAVAIFIINLIPYLTRKEERKLKYYNLSYHLMFGILYLCCGLILTYAINLMCGLTQANVKLFLSKLILPAILLTNFVLAPLLYKILIENKKNS